ncbi:Dbl homology domain-containing protein [Circinella umbellata]|nr:Dbl homology domain-containing protein [Circinella umbellata]
MSYGQFYDAITASSRASIRSRHTSFIPSTIEQQRRFVKNDERRDNLISEFILTEDNYVASLRAFITTIVHPIRTRARDKQKRILGPYECGKVFMNIEQILQVNEAFRLDLARYQSTVITGTTTTTTTPSQTIDFGEMCLNHLRRFVSYYHKFLLGVENAQTFNTKEQKDNPTYDAYLDEVKGTMGNQTVYDYLALPGQRVGRYTMFLKELIKHTTDDHSNLPGLTEALKTAEEIANMSEDYHTKLIKIFHNMLQSIQHCPASLLSQQRSLICHLDASELDPHTLRPVHPVTLFLFTDKLMVVRRPSYVSDGLELCGLDQERDKTGMLSLLVRKAESSKRYDRKLKFRGWISLNDIEIHDGAAELPTSFTLVTSVTDTTSDTDPQTRDALEGYFLEDSFRLFHLSEEYTSKSIKSLMEEKENFVEQFGKAKSGHKRIDDHLLEFTHGQWKGRYFFANIYRLSTYQLLPNKSAIAIAYLEGSFTSLKSQLSNCFTIPHMLGFIIPNKNDSIFRFSILSKLALGCISDDKECILDLTTQTESTFQQFRDRFLGNRSLCM